MDDLKRKLQIETEKLYCLNIPLIRKDVLFVMSYFWIRYEIFVLKLNLIKLS